MAGALRGLDSGLHLLRTVAVHQQPSSMLLWSLYKKQYHVIIMTSFDIKMIDKKYVALRALKIQLIQF